MKLVVLAYGGASSVQLDECPYSNSAAEASERGESNKIQWIIFGRRMKLAKLVNSSSMVECFCLVNNSRHMNSRNDRILDS